MAKTSKIGKESLLTSYQVGDLLQVNPSSVNKWVRDGRIRAFRTPGGHHRIRASDLVAFLRAHDMPVPKPLEGAARRRILVVDSDAAHLKAVQRALRPHSDAVELRTVSHGIDGLIELGSFRPDAVVIGAAVPGIDVVELCRRLQTRGDEGEPSTPQVIIVDDDPTSELERKTLRAGAVRYVEKPVPAEMLLEPLQESEPHFMAS